VYAVEDEVGDLGELGAAHHEARLAIEVRRRLGRAEPVFRVRSLGAYRLIVKAASGGDVLQVCLRTLDAVIEHDRKRGAALLETFRTYLHEGSSVKGAAVRLGVHPHTVLYRLDRLQELTGLSLSHAEDRLTLELALRVLDSAQAL
jgi:purine catabolism regulator